VVQVPVKNKDEDENTENNIDSQGEPDTSAESEPIEPKVDKELSLEDMTKAQLLDKAKAFQESVEENKDLYLRSQAEMENLKKRFKRDKEDWVKYANETLIKNLLPVVDNLEKAVFHAQVEDDFESHKEGVELTLKGLRDTLEKAGVKEVEALGKPFDPNFHMAMCEQEDAGAEAGTVLQEVQKGYLLNERLIRPAMVIVTKKKSE
jgi:molecular chaperone GrpE